MPDNIVEPLTNCGKHNINFSMYSGVTMERKDFLAKVKGCNGIICTTLNKIDKELLDAAGENLKAFIFTIYLFI